MIVGDNGYSCTNTSTCSDPQILKFHICDFCVIINHKALDARFTLLPQLSY